MEEEKEEEREMSCLGNEKQWATRKLMLIFNTYYLPVYQQLYVYYIIGCSETEV